MCVCGRKYWLGVMLMCDVCVCVVKMCNPMCSVCACAGLVPGAWCSFSGGDGWLCACVQHLWKGKEALQARDGSQCKSVRHRPRSRAAHRLLPSVLLAVMMAGCVLVCRASGRGRIHCKQEVLQIQLCAVHAPRCRCHSLRSSCCLVLFLQG